MRMEINRAAWDDLVTEFTDVREDYSGRGMYGGTCVAVVGDTGELLRFVHRLTTHPDVVADLNVGDLVETLADAALSDSMGTNIVFYFPGVTVEEEA